MPDISYSLFNSSRGPITSEKLIRIKKVQSEALLSKSWYLEVPLDYNRRVRPQDIQPIGEELAIKWEDQSETFIPLERLRRCCPCAGCKGEVDILGNLHKNPGQPLSSAAFRLVRVASVGGYAVQPFWADGHSTGLYTFDYLRRVAEASS